MIRILIVITVLLATSCSREEPQAVESVVESQNQAEQLIEIIESPYEKSIAVLPLFCV
jgi:hypothetical protein